MIGLLRLLYEPSPEANRLSLWPARSTRMPRRKYRDQVSGSPDSHTPLTVSVTHGAVTVLRTRGIGEQTLPRRKPVQFKHSGIYHAEFEELLLRNGGQALCPLVIGCRMCRQWYFADRSAASDLSNVARMLSEGERILEGECPDHGKSVTAPVVSVSTLRRSASQGHGAPSVEASRSDTALEVEPGLETNLPG